MKKSFIIVVLISLFSISNIYSQSFVDIKNTGTCEEALDISRFQRFGPTTAPEVCKKETSSYFNRAKHTAWYKFTVAKNGVLLFDIIPQKKTDNYDFILFKDEPDFCNKYNNKEITAFKSNFSASNVKKDGYTGLSFNDKGSSYEKAIDVKKGDKFYLALNNVYEKGEGHTIVFKYLSTLTIKGNITNQNNASIKAKIQWKSLRSEDVTVISKTKKKGHYEIKVPIKKESHSFPKYELCISAEKYFPEIKVFSTKEVNSLNNEKINFQLHKIKKGHNNEALGVVYFLPNETKTNPGSEKVMKKLLTTMQTNKKVTIILEGHTNGLFPTGNFDVILAQNRANVIKKYLVKNGIDSGRIKTKGYGCQYEQYPTPKSESEENFNRRVEVYFEKL